jgi:hypothetical protein
LLGADGVIPNGPGKGNLIVNTGYFDLNGHHETINGLSSTVSTGSVTNSAVGTWMLTIGAGDATSSFEGINNPINRLVHKHE